MSDGSPANTKDIFLGMFSLQNTCTPREFEVNDHSVYLLPVTTKSYREYLASLRVNGVPDPSKQVFGDELLVACHLVTSEGAQLFTTKEVLDGVFDEISPASFSAIVRELYRQLGETTGTETDGDRAKKSGRSEFERAVIRIARNSGMPPSVVEQTWSVSEIYDVIALDRLEGAGQDQRLTARICATIRNVMFEYAWLRQGDKDAAPPKMTPEEHYLPTSRRGSGSPEKSIGKPSEDVNPGLDAFNAACGF